MSERQLAFITGASRGIGKECALRFAKEGYDLAINYFPGSDEEAAGVVKELEAFGVKAKAYPCDVTDVEGVEKMVEAIHQDFGRIDVLVNNAGITRDNLLIRMRPEEWLAVINTNLNSLFYVTKPVAKVMMKQRSGSVVNIASIVGVYGNAGQPNYSAAKAGVIGFTKSNAKELATRGIRVNAVAPGFIETPMTEKLDKESLTKHIPMGRLGQPEDIADVVMFLARDAKYVTGQVIGIDGGLVI